MSNKADRFQEVLQRLLRPLARVMIARGVTIAAAVEVLKRAMVEAVEEDERDRGYLTDSRVSLLTGLHRKDVRRLRRGEVQTAKRSFEGACALIVAYWSADERFLNARGKPRHLAVVSGGGIVSFQDLMRSAGLDLPAATVLDELEATGVVSVNRSRSRIALLQAAYLPKRSSSAKLAAFEKNLDAHLSAASANLLAEGEAAPFFERAAHFNNLSVASIRKLDKMARKLKQALLERINREALAYQKQDSVDPENHQRISFGAYLHTSSDPDLREKTKKPPAEDDDR